MKFSVKDFFSKCDQICKKLRRMLMILLPLIFQRISQSSDQDQQTGKRA